MRYSNRLATIVLAALAVGLSVVPVNAGDAYTQHCAQCHGESGAGNLELGAPNLTGLSESYINRQLSGFKAGWRDNRDLQTRTMTSAIATLDDNSLSAAVAAIARLPHQKAKETAQTQSGDLARGKDLYTAYCSACHGTNGTGNDALGAPSLVGLDSDYMNRQYRHFVEGRRGFHPDDRYGKQMARLSLAVKDPNLIHDISSYVVQLPF